MNPEFQFESPQRLIENFRSGDLGAMKTLYQLHYKSVWYFANRILRDAEQAEDIVTETFVKLWERREKFDNLKRISSFLFLVTRNACFTHLKALKRKQASLKEIRYLSSETDQEMQAELVRAEMMRQVLLEAESFSPKMKKVFGLLYREGMSVENAARELGLSVFTIIAHKKNAISILRKKLAGKGFPLWLLF